MIYKYYFIGVPLSVKGGKRQYFITPDRKYIKRYIKLLYYNDILSNKFSLYKRIYLCKLTYTDLREHNVQFHDIKLVNSDVVNNLLQNVIDELYGEYKYIADELLNNYKLDLNNLELKYVIN
jgi:hypothetical protein